MTKWAKAVVFQTFPQKLGGVWEGLMLMLRLRLKLMLRLMRLRRLKGNFEKFPLRIPLNFLGRKSAQKRRICFIGGGVLIEKKNIEFGAARCGDRKLQLFDIVCSH